jgi:RNA polymerase primary sigma factor
MADKSERSKEVETEVTLEEAKKSLLELGKKSGELTFADIAEKLSVFELESDQIEEFIEQLEAQGVELGRKDGDEEDLEKLMKKGQEEETSTERFKRTGR